MTGLLFLTACTNVAMSGAQAVYNHHSIQKNLSDQYTTLQAFRALKLNDERFNDANISVATFNREVLLVGQVPSPWQRTQAEERVKQLPDIDRVYNLVTVSPPSSTLQRLSDAWITTKVKAKLIASNDIDATQIKVVTEDGTVYLMGMLFPSQAQAAVEIASHTGGVEKVVKVFSYLHVSKK